MAMMMAPGGGGGGAPGAPGGGGDAVLVLGVPLQQLLTVQGVTDAAREFWNIFGPGGRLHPAYFLEHRGHLVVEGLLLLVIVYLFLQHTFKPRSRSEAPLTEQARAALPSSLRVALTGAAFSALSRSARANAGCQWRTLLALAGGDPAVQRVEAGAPDAARPRGRAAAGPRRDGVRKRRSERELPSLLPRQRLRASATADAVGRALPRPQVRWQVPGGRRRQGAQRGHLQLPGPLRHRVPKGDHGAALVSYRGFTKSRVQRRHAIACTLHAFVPLPRTSCVAARTQKVAEETVDKYGVGACGPRGFYGTVDVHLQVRPLLQGWRHSSNCQQRRRAAQDDALQWLPPPPWPRCFSAASPPRVCSPFGHSWTGNCGTSCVRGCCCAAFAAAGARASGLHGHAGRHSVQLRHCHRDERHPGVRQQERRAHH